MAFPCVRTRRSLLTLGMLFQMAPVLRALNTRTLYGKLRFLCVLLVSSPDFDLIVIILIFVNCVSLSMFRPRQGVDSPWNQTLGLVELILNVSFTFELIARIIAVGGILVGPSSAACEYRVGTFSLGMTLLRCADFPVVSLELVRCGDGECWLHSIRARNW